MKISIVTASYNQAAYIKDALDSVRAQAYAQTEHLVIDNCSSDGSVEIIQSYPSVQLVCEPDKGQSNALNKGFKRASGDLIGWLNADDRYLPQCFDRVIAYFKQHPDCDVAYGDYRLIDEAGRVISNRQELPFDLFMLKYLHVLCIPSTTVFFRRRIFEEGNFLDEGYHLAMDYEYFVRLALKGYHFGYIPYYLADFRTHGQSKSCQQTKKQLQEMERALLARDPFLRVLHPQLRPAARMALMGAARIKRCGLKFLKGAYVQGQGT